MHACHCHLSSLHYTQPLPLVPSTEQSNCSYPTIKTSTTPVVYILASTIPWHGIELPFSPAILLYVRVLVGSCCFACLDVYIHINDHQCSACLIISPSPSLHRCRSTDPCIVITGAFTMHVRTPPDPCSQLNLLAFWSSGNQNKKTPYFVLSQLWTSRRKHTRPCLDAIQIPSFFTLSPSHQFLAACMEY